jgi:uncharacterized phiE125 gp8 family phage protein
MLGNLKLVSRNDDQLVVTLDEAKQHIRRTDTNEDDELILRYLKAATQHVENWCGLALVDQTWDYWTDEFPGAVNYINQPLYLPRAPLLEVIGVFYNSPETELDSTGYFVDYAGRPGSVYLGDIGSWPTSGAYKNAVRVRFRAGYIDLQGSPSSSAEQSVPEDIKAAIMIYTGTMFDYREAYYTGTAQTAVLMPWGAEQILRQYRVETSIA